MRLLSKVFERDGSGTVAMIPEEPEDMWHLYHLLAAGDILRSTTIRKVKSETATGSVDSQKVRTSLSIEVAAVEFDVAGCMLRVNGRNMEENQFVRMGAFHSIEMELQRKFSLVKRHWDAVALDRIELACDASRTADVAAVVMQEGLAHVCLVTPHMTLLRCKIDTSIARKGRGSSSQHEKGLERFYESVFDAIVRHVKFDVVKCVLIASPGFVREHFAAFMFAHASRTECKAILENRAKFLLVHSTSGYMQALKGERACRARRA